ncbi:probable galacturonosyltransferase 4 [Phragmites australis]|uniref:probable galacturonosyltransferase 4 n=1 Tax=Phragmites australis TaxID=29695 RepID=UPI002D783359|nr:probable galacturonosyltransferase 4 [Phragmites australis]
MLAAARGRRRCRGAVLLLLLASVLAPLVLYGGSPVSVSQLPDSTVVSGAFDGEDASNLVWPQMAASEVSLTKDLTIERLGEHKNRVLSATDHWQVVEAASRSRASGKSDASVVREEYESRNVDEEDNPVVVGNDNAQLEHDGMIKEVVGRERREYVSDKLGDIEEAELQNGKGGGTELPHAIDVEHKNGSDEAGRNNISGMHTTGNLNSSSNEESTARGLPGQVRDATPREYQTRATNSNAALHATNSSAAQSATLPDATIRIIKDQLRRAKTYLGFVASRGNHGFARELRARMMDIQRALGDATSDRQLPQNVHNKIREMEQTLVKVRKIHDSCSGAVNRFRTALHSTEQQLQSHKRQTNYLAQIAAKSLPKGLHCLTLRLTNEYYSTNSKNKNFPYMDKLEDPKLYHYALFSDNVLAAAVVVNSTLVHAKKPENHIFHIVTDRLNYAAMKMWFLSNPLGEAAIQVQNIEDFTWLNSSYSPVLKQLESRFMIDYYFRSVQARPDENPKFRNPKYLSILNHLRFYLPEIFPKLNKVLFLDDDTVVQRDLSALWLIDLKGKVNGAVETCRETFHRFDKYLNFSNPLIDKNFDPHACGWAYGMNMFDLSEWRKQNITEVYHTWQKLNENRLLWKLGTLPAGLVTFWNRTFPLDRSWHQLGLGYNPNVNEKDIRRASVIHYNGNLKPWLDIGLPKYRKYWSTYVNFDQTFLRECNMNP